MKIAPKSRIQICERSELRLHFEWSKVTSKCQKWFNLASFRKPEACGQTVLPDQNWERSELGLHFEWSKLTKKCQKWSNEKPETCRQTVLPDRSLLLGQKLVKNAKSGKCDILSNFQLF